MSQPLSKSINFFALTMIATGACIGSGIFISPSDVAGQLSNGTQVLLVWLIGGIVTITGALSFGELAARFPGTGGVYIYLRNAYGDLLAFLYGWCILTVITSGAIAALCIAFARYFTVVFNTNPEIQIPIALGALLTVTLINIVSVRTAATFSSALTVIKIAGIGMLVICCLIYGQDLIPNLRTLSATPGQVSFGIALIGVLWSYGGWHHASYVSGEVMNANKIVPKALIAGGVIVTLVYLAANAAYLSVMSVSEMAGSDAIAAEALGRVTLTGGLLVAIMITLSTFGTAGIYTLSAPRIYFKMGEDRVFFSWLSDLHPTFGTPVKAILLQSVWAGILMLFWGSFESLATYVVFMDWIFMTLAAFAIYIFRKKYADQVANYKVPFYPVIPLIFIGISIWFLFSTLIGRPVQAVAGIVLMLIGLPVYYFFRWRKSRSI